MVQETAMQTDWTSQMEEEAENLQNWLENFHLL